MIKAGKIIIIKERIIDLYVRYLIYLKNIINPITTEKMEANNQLAGVLGRLFAVAESYPDLKANASFLDLQNQLKETEDKIGFSRQFYNDTAMKYNVAIARIPTSIIASIFGFKGRPYFEAEGESRERVEVKF